MTAGGGWAALLYSLERAGDAGGLWKLYRRLSRKNACKTCAFGMGGQQGGMTNESGAWPEVCKKSIQAQAADMQPPIPLSLFERTSVGHFATMDPMTLEYLGRIGHPMVLRSGDTHYRPIAWEDALDAIAADFRERSPDALTFYSSGRASNEAAFLLQCVARAAGTNNVHNCSYYCHQASGVGLHQALGSGTASVSLDDLEHADLAMVIGANPASNHPRLITQLVAMRKRGGQVIVLNPVRELGLERFRIPSQPWSFVFGSKVSDLYLQPKIGGDIAVLKGMLKALLAREGAIDRSFLASHVDGWPAVESDAMATSWETIERHSGLTRAAVEDAAARYANSKKALFMWAMGITHHEHGVDNVFAITNLALARGMVGKPHAGVMPIRGHSNVQGIGSVGVAPALKEAFAERLTRLYGIEVPKTPGLDTYRTILAMNDGTITGAFCLGGNLFSSNPDTDFTRTAMQKVETTVYVSTKLNPGHFHGRGRTTYILPCLARDEEHQATSQESMFNYVRLSEGGSEPATADMKSEVEIIAGLAARWLPKGKVDWSRFTSHDALRAAIADVVPGWEDLRNMGTTKREFTISGRVRHVPEFPLPGGKARAFVTPMPDNLPPPGHLMLMTLRSEGQFNTVVYDKEDIYRAIDRRDVAMLNADDAMRMGFAHDDIVRVETTAGALDGLRVRILDVPAGSLVMYYPEANAIVPRKIDPKSGTPAFKSVPARVVKSVGRPAPHHARKASESVVPV
ncbi:MAG TPA: FdhF/YdeP family oxidoreductase [Candidatus Eisenbacteria bacterium]